MEQRKNGRRFRRGKRRKMGWCENAKGVCPCLFHFRHPHFLPFDVSKGALLDFPLLLPWYYLLRAHVHQISAPLHIQKSTAPNAAKKRPDPKTPTQEVGKGVKHTPMDYLRQKPSLPHSGVGREEKIHDIEVGEESELSVSPPSPGQPLLRLSKKLPPGPRSSQTRKKPTCAPLR